MRAGKIILVGTATIAIGAAWALARVNRDIDAALTWGDGPHLSPEMVEGLAATRENDSAGRSVLHGQRPLGFARHIAHDSGASNR